MFNVGDTIIYSSHGLCHIDSISDKTFSGVTKTYYILHPLNNPKLEICAPVSNKTNAMLELMSQEDAEEIMTVFNEPGMEWIEKTTHRTQTYADRARKGNRQEIAKIIKTLMVKKIEIERNEKKFPENDRKLLSSMQDILFAELALSLKTTIEQIHDKVEQIIVSELETITE